MTNAEAAEAATPLLETKLHAPRRRREVVDRPRLTDRLVVGTPPALTLVSAPAGFGKTTLLAEWFAGLDGRAARRRGCPSTPATTTRPCSGPTSSPRCRRSCPRPVPTPCRCCGRPSRCRRSWRRCSTTWQALGDDVVLVLDDYHVIESAELHEAVAFLLEHLPPQVHLVLGEPGRSAPAAGAAAGPRRAARGPRRRPAVHRRRGRRPTSTRRWACT